MGLFNKKEELPGSALRFLSAAFPAEDDKKPALSRPGHLPVLDKIGAKAILKDIDWDAPEAKDFLAAASIDAADLPSFKIGDKPEILVGAFKDPIRIELFERLLCCSCCCGSCRICKWYPFCRRRCGRVLFELKDGSTYWAYRVRVIGGDVEKDLAHPGGVKITIAAAGGGVSQADFDNHKTSSDHDTHNDGLYAPKDWTPSSEQPSGYAPANHNASHDDHNDDRYAPLNWTDSSELPSGYAPAAHTSETDPHSGKFAPKDWTTGSVQPNGYAPASHTSEATPHSTVLAAKAPRVWDGTTPVSSAPEGYATATHAHFFKGTATSFTSKSGWVEINITGFSAAASFATAQASLWSLAVMAEPCFVHSASYNGSDTLSVYLCTKDGVPYDSSVTPWSSHSLKIDYLIVKL